MLQLCYKKIKDKTQNLTHMDNTWTNNNFCNTDLDNLLLLIYQALF